MDEGKGAVHGQFEREFLHSHEHQWRHLAGSPGHCQNQAGHDARQCPRQHDPADRLPFAGAAGIGAFPHRVGHRRQRLLGRDDHHRQGQQREGQRSPEQAASAKHRLAVSHQA